jgi:hypothetical protein
MREAQQRFTVWREFSVCAPPARLLSELQDVLAEGCASPFLADSPRTLAVTATDNVENRTDGFWLCNMGISRALRKVFF